MDLKIREIRKIKFKLKLGKIKIREIRNSIFLLLRVFWSDHSKFQ